MPRADDHDRIFLRFALQIAKIHSWNERLEFNKSRTILLCIPDDCVLFDLHKRRKMAAFFVKKVELKQTLNEYLHRVSNLIENPNSGIDDSIVTLQRSTYQDEIARTTNPPTNWDINNFKVKSMNSYSEGFDYLAERVNTHDCHNKIYKSSDRGPRIMIRAIITERELLGSSYGPIVAHPSFIITSMVLTIEIVRHFKLEGDPRDTLSKEDVEDLMKVVLPPNLVFRPEYHLSQITLFLILLDEDKHPKQGLRDLIEGK